MCDLAQEGEDESNLGDGACRWDESWRGAGLEDVNGCCLIVEKNKMED